MNYVFRANKPMIARWTEWKSFPDAYYGEYIQAPIGPGLYEVCQTATREQVAFGYSQNVAETLTNLLKPGKVERRSFFFLRPTRTRYANGELEYRTWAVASVADAKVAVDQVLAQREAVVRRFSPGARP
jgi:hypothetical protein